MNTVTNAAMRTQRTRAAAVLALALAACSQPTPPPPVASEAEAETAAPAVAWFEPFGDATGIDFVHRSGAQGRYFYPESMSGGVALCDVDNDDDLDLYFVQGGSLEPGETQSFTDRLYRNRGDGTFADATAATGLGSTGYGMGVACGDIDADGDLDLYVTQVGPNVLYRNHGDGTFSDVTTAAGVGDPGWGASALFFDADRDHDLDLFVVNYLDWSVASEQDCRTATGEREYCGPSSYRAPARDVLYQNQGDGTFRQVTTAAGLDRAFGNGLGAVATDFDDDGWADLYVANDQMPNQLWHNRGDGTFVDAALLAGTAVNRSGLAEAGMGAAVVDIDNDGDSDIFLSHLAGETNTLYHNLAERGIKMTFDDATARLGLAAASYPFTGFGLGFADFDHDGWLDLYIANGRVTRGLPLYDPQDPYAEPDLLFRGSDRGFEPLRQQQPPVATGRGAAFGDVDGDGDIDVVVANRDAPPLLLRNVAAAGAWIRFRVIDSRGSDALGAFVELESAGRRQRRAVQPGYSYLASNDPRVHFGLAQAERLDQVTVLWPGGEAEIFGPFATGRGYTLQQGTASER